MKIPPRQAAPSAPQSSLAERYRRIRAATESICAPLSAEDMVIQSMPDASPAKWHLAHTSWFFEAFVLAALGKIPFHPGFAYLFNSYYETVGSRLPRPARGLITRPSVADVYRYRAQIDTAMKELLLDDSRLDHLRDVIELGLNHEQQHQELMLTDIKHAFAQNPLLPAYRERASRPAPAASEVMWVEFDADLHQIGHEGTGFAFDNEGPSHRVFLEAFAIASRPATCGEYLSFMNDNGYTRPEFWLSDGWQVSQANGWTAPLYWRRHGSCWHVFGFGGNAAIDENEPVSHLSFYEADAFARWSGARLPSEAEWEVAGVIPNGEPGADEFRPSRLNPACTASTPSSPPMGSIGEVWEWTQSAYAPYPGFRPAAGALGEYNGKFMCNQMVLRGGSYLTPRSHLRSTYRNFFPPEARWQVTGPRLARSR